MPTMHVTATDDVIEIPGYRSDVADRLAIFDAIVSPHKLLAVFRGGSTAYSPIARSPAARHSMPR